MSSSTRANFRRTLAFEPRLPKVEDAEDDESEGAADGDCKTIVSTFDSKVKPEIKS